ncbi:MAG: MFS transporter [Acidimicrobiia bacterium]
MVNTALRFVYPFLPAIARGLGVDLTQAGMLVSARWAAGLATPAVMSFSGDVSRSRRLLIWGLATFSAGSVVTAWAGMFAGAVIGFALLGLAKPMVDIGAQVYISERVPYGSRARYLGTLEIAWAGGLLVGAPVAGWLIENWSWEAPFWALGSAGALGLGLALLVLDHNDEAVSNPAHKADDSPGRQVILLMTAASLFAYAHESLLVTLGGWLEGSFDMSLLALGGVGTLVGVSELVGEGAMVGFTDRIGKRNSVALGFGVAALAVFVLSLVSDLLFPAISALVLAAVALEFGYISAIPLMTELRPRSRTRVLALFAVANGLGRIGGDLIAPRVFERAGMRGVTLMAFFVILGSLVVVISGVRDVGVLPKVRSSLGR